jgi:hypothetical protein
VYPKGSRIVSFDSVRPRDEGDPSVIYIVRGGPEMSNGAYTLRVQVEASGVYTPVGEATVTRACP